MNKTGIVIVNYNMWERTDALVEHIVNTVKLPYKMVVVDNGSDLVPMSQYTRFTISKNVQTTQGFLAGLDYLDEDYFAYWLFITSAEFIKEDLRDPLEILLSVLENDPLAYAVQPSIIFNYHQAWSDTLSPRKGGKPRRVWGTDYISTLFRVKHFIRFRKELTMMWGVPGECNWKARKAGLHIYAHDGYTMRKETDVGYTMDRMKMDAKTRRNLASAESNRILEPIYGKNYRRKFGYEYRATGGEY